MAVKFNKEMLLKHRFWVLVGVTTFLTLFGILYLELYGSELTDKVRKDLKATLDKIKREQGDKGPVSVDEMAKNADFAKNNESKVWSDSYTEQEKYFKWADQIETEFQFLKGKFAREIKISKKIDNKKEWPEDTPFVDHGELVKIEPTWLHIKKRNGEVEKINAMDTVKINADGQAKPLSWGEIAEHGKNALLAITYQKGKYFNDPLTDPEKKAFKATYVEQIHQILQSVDPLDEKGNGVVQLRNWLYSKDEEFDDKWKDTNRFLRVVNKPWELGKEISPEAWIAQENLWIQRELYRIIRSANDDIAIFKWDGGDLKKKSEDLQGSAAEKRDTVYRFKNSSFALDLVLHKDNKLSFTIKNLLTRRQKLDLNFRVLLNNEAGRKPEVIHISGLPLMPIGDKEKKDSIQQDIPVAKEGKDAPRKGIYGVEQLLTWETAAVKRIDHVSIGSNAADDIAHSHRTFPDDLRPLVVEEKPVDKDQLKKEPARDVGRPGQGPIGGGGGGGAGNKIMLPHGLWTDRYVAVSEQSRRVPVAVALIVDQDHVDRVLTAFNNSKLRFLETQVLLNHYGGSLQPPMAEEKKEGGGVGGPIRPGPFPGPSSGPSRFPGAGSTGPAATAAGGDSESNMEIVIYGIMTLYQRYPPRPAFAVEKKQ